MSARLALVVANLKLKTFDAVKVALEHSRELLLLSRRDNMGVRWMVPHMMLRLSKDQDCYDFVKRWRNSFVLGEFHDWDDLTLLYLDEKNADVYENVDYLCDDMFASFSLSHLIAVTLLKIRLLISLNNYKASALIHKIKIDPKHTNGEEQLPIEIVDQVRAEVLGSVMIENLKGREPASMIKDLNVQILQLYETVHNTNKHFWPALLKPGNHLNATVPVLHTHGGVEDMQINLVQSYDAWAETPGAIAFIESLSKK